MTFQSQSRRIPPRHPFRAFVAAHEHTLTSLSAESGVSRQTMYKWMWGKAEPTPSSVFHITAVLHCTASELRDVLKEGLCVRYKNSR